MQLRTGNCYCRMSFLSVDNGSDDGDGDDDSDKTTYSLHILHAINSTVDTRRLLGETDSFRSNAHRHTIQSSLMTSSVWQ